MKTYLLIVKVYDYETETDIDEDEYTEIFSNFEKAKEYGLNFINQKLNLYCKDKNKSINQCIKDKLVDYDFKIIEEDIEYAEKFDKTLEIFEEIEELLIYEPTHKEYILNHLGKITNICIRYLPNQKESLGQNTLYLKPNDLLESAGTKFKIGDLVKIIEPNKKLKDLSYYDYHGNNNICVVRYLPRRIEGQKYLRNTYALSEIDDENYAHGIYTWEFHEEQIALYDGPIEDNSPIDILRKILKKEIKINTETWNQLKYGQISLREQDKNQSNYYKKVLKYE